MTLAEFGAFLAGCCLGAIVGWCVLASFTRWLRESTPLDARRPLELVRPEHEVRN